MDRASAFRGAVVLLTFIGVFITVILVSILVASQPRVVKVVKEVPKVVPVYVSATAHYRHIASGRYSLATVAKVRHTTPVDLERVTEDAPELSAANRKAFMQYVKQGVEHRMPRNLVYYTIVGPAEG